jgi:hypothetical protein
VKSQKPRSLSDLFASAYLEEIDRTFKEKEAGEVGLVEWTR